MLAQSVVTRNEHLSNLTEATMTLITLTYGRALQAIWARDSHAITAARATFARAHGIAPAEVAVAVEYAGGPFERASTTEELAIINAA